MTGTSSSGKIALATKTVAIHAVVFTVLFALFVIAAKLLPIDITAHVVMTWFAPIFLLYLGIYTGVQIFMAQRKHHREENHHG